MEILEEINIKKNIYLWQFAVGVGLHLCCIHQSDFCLQWKLTTIREMCESFGQQSNTVLSDLSWTRPLMADSDLEQKSTTSTNKPEYDNMQNR